MEVPLTMHLRIMFAAKISSTFQKSVFINTFWQNAAPTIHSVKKTALPFYNRVYQYEHDLNTKVILATPRNIPSSPPSTVPIITTNTKSIVTLTYLNPYSGSYPRDTKTIHISIHMSQKPKAAPATRSSSNIQPQKSSSTKTRPSWPVNLTQ